MNRTTLLALIAFLIIVAPSGAFGKSPRKLVIELRGKAEHAPSAVCLLGVSGGTLVQQEANELVPLRDVVDFGFFQLTSNGADGEDTFLIPPQLPPKAAGGMASPSVVPKKSDTLRVSDQQQRAARSDQLRTLLQVPSQAAQPKCAVLNDDPHQPKREDACRRSFQAKQTDYLICHPNPDASAEALVLQRVLFVSLRSLYNVAPQLVHMEVRRNALIVTLRDELELGEGRVAPLRAVVVGGDYLPTNPSIGSGEQLAIDLIPRCAQHTLVVTGGLLSPVQGAASKAAPQPELRLSLMSGDHPFELTQCISKLDELPLKVVLPYRLASTSTLTLSVRDREPNPAASTLPQLSFEGSWVGAVPTQTILLKATQVRFEWELHCAYPWPVCPTDVTLPDAGIQCTPDYESPTNRRCAYTCPGADASRLNANAPFTLPQAVQFSIHDSSKAGESTVSETWTETLYHSRQLLSSYVPPPQRHIAVHFCHWQRSDLETPGQEVQYVEVRSPGGQFYRVKPKEGGSVQLNMPGITCTDHVSYRPVGDRQYEENVVRVDQGGISPERPGKMARDAFSVGISVGGGIKPAAFEVIDGKEDLAAFGWGDFIALWRRPRLWAASSLMPNLEVRLGVLYTVAAYSIRASADPANVSTGTVPYLYVPMTAAATWDFPKGLSLSAGLGPAFSLPTQSQKRELAPVQWSPALVFAFGVRVPGSPITVELMYKLLFSSFYEIQLNGEGDQPHIEPVLAPPMFLGLGARFGN